MNLAPFLAGSCKYLAEDCRTSAQLERFVLELTSAKRLHRHAEQAEMLVANLNENSHVWNSQWKLDV